MLRSVTFIVALLAIAAASAVPAESRSRGYARTWKAPVRDCTRLNGRFGYYGNPWCSPAEQQQWDRASARRFSR
jgi:hypothetical protein